MRKLLFISPVVAMLAAGCGAAPQTPTQAPSVQATAPVTAPAPALAPTPTTNNLPPQAQAVKDRDDARRANMQQLHDTLELYFDDYKSYPQTLPVLISKNYVEHLPQAPEPADGNCTEQQNTYVYTLTSPQSYTVTFCLGVGSEIYGPGMHTLTPSGIK